MSRKSWIVEVIGGMKDGALRKGKNHTQTEATIEMG